MARTNQKSKKSADIAPTPAPEVSADAVVAPVAVTPTEEAVVPKVGRKSLYEAHPDCKRCSRRRNRERDYARVSRQKRKAAKAAAPAASAPTPKASDEDEDDDDDDEDEEEDEKENVPPPAPKRTRAGSVVRK